MKLSFSLFAMSLVAKNQVHGSMLRGQSNDLLGRNLEGGSPPPTTPTCEQVEDNHTTFMCTERCSEDYWQCVNGEVLKMPMAPGTHCIDGDVDEFHKCKPMDDRCPGIEALNQQDKIMCTEECSDTYLACTNGNVLEMPMPDGTKCYRDGIVRTAAGHCVVQEEVITYFEIMDACMNYPDLEHCASSADPASPPYNGAVYDDGAWYFTDKVWFSYISTYSEEYQWSDEHGWYNGKGWDVFINIRFGHDQEVGRSRSIIASMDYGTTQIYKWNQYDLVDGEDDAHYNCLAEVPDEPVTHMITQIIKNPAIIFGLGQGKFDIPDDDEVHNFTAKVSVPASELGDEEGAEGDVEVLVESDDADEELEDPDLEPVVTPTFLFKNVIVYDEDFFNESQEDIEDGYGDDDEEDDEDEDEDEDVEDIPDDGSDMPTIETIEEIRKLFDGYFNVTLNETVCEEGFEQVYNNETDVVAPLLNRGKLLAGTGESDDGSGESIVNGTEALSDQIEVEGIEDPISRRLFELTKKSGQEKFTIPQDSIYDCDDGQVIANHCCSEDTHFLACTPTLAYGDCPEGSEPSSRCVEANAQNDVVVEPRFLKGNIPMQLHTADHLESLEYELENLLTEENMSELFDRSNRNLYWDEYSPSVWWRKEEEEFTSGKSKFLPKELQQVKQYGKQFSDLVGEPIHNDTEVTPEELWDNYGDLFIGRGGGLDNVKELLEDLTDLNENLSEIYDMNLDVEDSMLAIYRLMDNVDRTEPELRTIDRTLSTLERVLKLVSIIKYVKPIAVPIRNVVAKTRSHGTRRALAMVHKIQKSVTNKYKPKLRKYLPKNEELRGLVAKGKFLNQNMLITPFNFTRNCEPSDNAAKAINSAVDKAVIDTSLAFGDLAEFKEAIAVLVRELKGVINLVDDMLDAIAKMAEKANPIKLAMDPFYKALSARISVPIFGPFCRKTIDITVPYPCGVKKCRKCRRIFRKKRCIKFPCGIKKCYMRRRVRVRAFCKKRFSFTVNQVLNGISGVMDIIFYPINKATDFLLKAIPMPKIPLLPAFPTNFGALDRLIDIANLLDGPKFPHHLLDFPRIDLALPGLNDIVCDKSLSELYEAFELVKNKELTHEYVREFYDGCGGMQDLNPVCHTTEELLCGDGGCPTESPANEPEADNEISA